MKKLLLLLFLLASCAVFYQPDPASINGLYYDQIREWQERIQKEGWTQDLANDVVNQCLKLSKYRKEKDDHWDTPKEFMERGFQGDCEDIAVFMIGTFKRLEYPHSVRILAIKTLMGDHAIVKVEMPEGNWKTYETVPMPLGQIDRLFYSPIVEFDEETIFYYQ